VAGFVNRFAGIRPLLSLYNYNKSATFAHMSLSQSPFIRLRILVLEVLAQTAWKNVSRH